MLILAAICFRKIACAAEVCSTLGGVTTSVDSFSKFVSSNSSTTALVFSGSITLVLIASSVFYFSVWDWVFRRSVNCIYVCAAGGCLYLKFVEDLYVKQELH